MARKKGTGGTRHVIQLSDENTLAVHAALTLPGEAKPQFGAQSRFFNLLLDQWRARQAAAVNEKEQPQ